MKNGDFPYISIYFQDSWAIVPGMVTRLPLTIHRAQAGRKGPPPRPRSMRSPRAFSCWPWRPSALRSLGLVLWGAFGDGWSLDWRIFGILLLYILLYCIYIYISLINYTHIVYITSYIYIYICTHIILYIMAVDLNSFICKRPFFANKTITFVNLSRTPRLSVAGSHIGTLAAL